MSIYADTSFLVSTYVKDAHHARVGELLRSEPTFWFTPLHKAEWAHTIAQHIFRGVLSVVEADELYYQLELDISAGVWLETELPESALKLCADLARRHGPKFGMKTLDTLHVACALELKAERFWTFDERQAKLAEEQGLKIR